MDFKSYFRILKLKYLDIFLLMNDELQHSNAVDVRSREVAEQRALSSRPGSRRSARTGSAVREGAICFSSSWTSYRGASLGSNKLKDVEIECKSN